MRQHIRIILASASILTACIIQPAQAVIQLDKPQDTTCYDFKTVQDIDAIVATQFDSHYAEDVNDDFKLYYIRKTEGITGAKELLNEEEYNKKRNDLKSTIMLSPCPTTK
ncbi:hypothetical protein [Pseudomonas sp. HY7a-MNA-CIBAN-0227]|uniref:hypothetical protein n=1 Tax=Pseudomonas sp. HY7a-MNA-CIBAN-0227 TaxID=3140474 RepID=UPI0033299EA5